MAIEQMLTRPTYIDLAEKIVTAQLPCFEFNAFAGDFPKVEVKMHGRRYEIVTGGGRYERRCFYTASRGKYELAASLEKMTDYYQHTIVGGCRTPLYETSKISFHPKSKKAGVPIPTYHHLADKLTASLDCDASVNGNRVSDSALLLQGKDERTNIHVSVMEETLSGRTDDKYYTVKVSVGNSPKSFWFINRISPEELPVQLMELAYRLLRRAEKSNCGLTEIYVGTVQKKSYSYQNTYDDLANMLVADLGNYHHFDSSICARSSTFMPVLSKKGSETVYVRISQEIPYSYNKDFDRYTIEIANGNYSYELFYTKSLDRGELAAKLEEVVKGHSAKAKERGLELAEVYASAIDQDFESIGT